MLQVAGCRVPAQPRASASATLQVWLHRALSAALAASDLDSVTLALLRQLPPPRVLQAVLTPPARAAAGRGCVLVGGAGVGDAGRLPRVGGAELRPGHQRRGHRGPLAAGGPPRRLPCRPAEPRRGLLGRGHIVSAAAIAGRSVRRVLQVAAAPVQCRSAVTWPGVGGPVAHGPAGSARASCTPGPSMLVNVC
jgi:hypothetical protein